MPGRSKRSEGKLEAALLALGRGLNASKAPWMTIGGIATIASGVQRLTTDIDVVVRGDSIGVRALVATLAKQEIKPRIANAIAFAEANLVLLLRHQPSGVDLDVSFAWTTFELEAIAACAVRRYGRANVPMAGPEDLVVMKAMAARPKDIEDAAALLALYPQINLKRVRQRLIQLSELAGEPELLNRLDALLAEARAARPKRRPTNTKARKRRT